MHEQADPHTGDTTPTDKETTMPQTHVPTAAYTLSLHNHPGGLVSCACPCGRDLGMRDPAEAPTCGDEDCEEYLEDHPDWHSEAVQS